MTYPEGYSASQTVMDKIFERLVEFKGTKVVESGITEETLSDIIEKYGFKKVSWLFPEETLFYQPIVIAEK